MGEERTERAQHSKNVKQYLRRVAHPKELLADLIRERDEVREIAGTIGSPGFDERVQTSQGNEAAFVRKLDRVFAIEERINAEINHISDISVDIGARIERLPSYDERRVIRYRYMDNQSWDEISVRMNVSLRTVHRIHSMALAHFEIPEDGDEDSTK